LKSGTESEQSALGVYSGHENHARGAHRRGSGRLSTPVVRCAGGDARYASRLDSRALEKLAAGRASEESSCLKDYYQTLNDPENIGDAMKHPLFRSVFLFWRDVWALPKIWRITVVSLLVIVFIVGQPLRDRPKTWLGFLVPAASFIVVVGAIRFVGRKPAN